MNNQQLTTLTEALEKLCGPATKGGRCVTGGWGVEEGAELPAEAERALKFIRAGDKALTGVYVNDGPTDSSTAWH